MFASAFKNLIHEKILLTLGAKLAVSRCIVPSDDSTLQLSGHPGEGTYKVILCALISHILVSALISVCILFLYQDYRPCRTQTRLSVHFFHCAFFYDIYKTIQNIRMPDISFSGRCDLRKCPIGKQPMSLQLSVTQPLHIIVKN